MPTLVPTGAKGARSSSVEMTYVDPAHEMTPDEQQAFLKGTGLNGPFVADLLSDLLAHERCGAQLYRSVAQRTNNPVLQQRYEHFGEETTRHVEILEQLISELGGDPLYVSPAARATTKSGSGLLESTFLVSGSIDPMTQELVLLDAVLLAEAKDHANWECLAGLVEHAPEGPVRDALQRATEAVRPQEDEHFAWASDTRCKLVSVQARSRIVRMAGATSEDLVARIRSWLD